MTDLERAAVLRLRTAVAAEPLLAASAARDHLTDDANLLRFLRARDLDHVKAKAMWRAHLEWRAASGIDAAVAEPDEPMRRFMAKWWPEGELRGTDYEGLPVDLLRLGVADLFRVDKLAGRDRLVEFAATHNEHTFARLRELSERTGRLETSNSIIMDLHGLGRRHFRAVPAFAALTKMAEPNYPERVAHIFVVRAPWIFHSLYALIKPLLNEGTRNKVMILGEDFLPTLLKYMPLETVPTFLHGTGDASHISSGGLLPDDEKFHE